MAIEEPTLRTVVGAFTDFLTVAIHTILYERSVYPRTSFLSARKYNFAVHQSRHPKVCEWINDAVSAVEAELFRGAVDKVVVVIFNKSNKPLERYVFDLSRFPTVQPNEIDQALQRPNANGEQQAILPLVDMEQQFRATMSKLSNCSSSLRDIPEGCTYTVAIELKDQGEPPIRHPQPWIPTEPSEGDPQPSVRPIRSVSAGEMIFETWVEQAEIELENSP